MRQRILPFAGICERILLFLLWRLSVVNQGLNIFFHMCVHFGACLHSQLLPCIIALLEINRHSWPYGVIKPRSSSSSVEYSRRKGFFCLLILLIKVWTSQLKRAVDTAQYLKGVSIERWKALNEMDHVSIHTSRKNGNYII